MNGLRHLATAALALFLAGCCCGEYEPPDPAERAVEATVANPVEEHGITVLARPRAGKVHRLVADRDTLYWAGGHRERAAVFAVPKKGGKTRLVALIKSNVVGIDPHKSKVYVGAWDGIHRVNEKSGKSSIVATVDGDIRSFTSDKKSVYFSTGKAIFRLDKKSGAKPVKLFEGLSLWAPPLGVDDKYLYFGSNKDKTITRVDKKKGGKGKVVAKDVFPGSDHPLFVDKGHLYFYQDIPRSVRRVELDSGEVTELSVAAQHFRGLAIDKKYVYWGTGEAIIGTGIDARLEGEGRVLRVSRKGGKARELITGLKEVEGVAVDDDRVFVLEDGHGIIGYFDVE